MFVALALVVVAALLGWRIAKRFKLVSPRTRGGRQTPASKPSAS